jgi:hypothetical protein
MLTDDVLSRVHNQNTKRKNEDIKNMKIVDKLIINDNEEDENENKNANKKKIFKRLETVKIKSDTKFKLDLVTEKERNLDLIEKAQLNLEIKKLYNNTNENKENEENNNKKKKYKRSLTVGNKVNFKEKDLEISDDEDDKKNKKNDKLNLNLDDDQINNKEKNLTIQEPLKTYSNKNVRSSFKKKKMLTINDFPANNDDKNTSKFKRKFVNSKTLKLDSHNEMTKEIISSIKSKKVKFIDDNKVLENKKKNNDLDKYLLNDD